MNSTKAVILTLLLVSIEAGVMLLFFLAFDTRNNPDTFVHATGAGILAARFIAYSCIFFFFWKPSLSRKHIQDKQFHFPTLICLILLLLGTEFLNRPFLDLETVFFPSHSPTANYSFNGFTATQIYRSISALLLAPILEELFFRKFLLQGLIKKHSIPVALLTSSLLFSLIHWETPSNLIPSFLFGVISGILYLKTGKLRYSILLHFMYNGLSLLVAINAELYYDWLSWLGTGILYWSLFVLGITICLLALKMLPPNRQLQTKEYAFKKTEP